MHQPVGAITPSTSLHDAGASKFAQLAQLCLPFGVGRYDIAFGDILFDAAAGGAIKPAATTAPPPAAAVNRKSRRDSALLCLFVIIVSGEFS